MVGLGWGQGLASTLHRVGSGSILFGAGFSVAFLRRLRVLLGVWTPKLPNTTQTQNNCWKREDNNSHTDQKQVYIMRV